MHFPDILLDRDQIDKLFGDQAEILPAKITHKSHWSKGDHGDRAIFDTAWRQWQADIGFDLHSPETRE